MKFDVRDLSGFGEGAGGELVGFGLVVLLDGQVKIAGAEVGLLGKRDGEQVRLIRFGVRGEAEREIGGLAGGACGDGVDASGTSGGEQQLGCMSGDEIGSGSRAGGVRL